MLLKPHIILFSTDVAPINSGPLVNPIERLPLASSYKNSKRNLKNHMAGPESVQEILGGEEGVMMEKTCDCSTTAIACYGCGGIVGCKSPSIDSVSPFFDTYPPCSESQII